MLRPLLLLLALSLPARSQDMSFGTPDVERYLWNGDPARKIDIIVLGDGYTAEDQAKYASDFKRCVDYLLTEKPYAKHKSLFNVHKVNLISKESEIWGIAHNTALEGTLADYRNEKNLQTALARTDAYTMGQDLYVILMNSGAWSGMGGPGFFAIVNQGARAREVMAHEFGHAIANLSDEYVKATRGRRYASTWEPNEPNITIESDIAKVKWKKYVGQEGVGLFEGAFYGEFGIYRPALDCRMNSAMVPYCLVCREAVRRSIRDRVLTFKVVQNGEEVRLNASNDEDIDPMSQGAVSCAWRLGDGETASGRFASKTFRADSQDATYRLFGIFMIGLDLSYADGETALIWRRVRPIFPFAVARVGPRSFRFDATNSVKDGAARLHRWQFGDGTAAEGRVVTHDFANDGSYAVALLVDPEYTPGTRTQTVTIARPRLAPVAERMIPLGGTLSMALAADGSTLVPDVRILDSAGTSVFAIDSLQVSWTPAVPGRHTLVARVTDAFGLSSNSVSAPITVYAILRSPTAWTGTVWAVLAWATAPESDGVIGYGERGFWEHRREVGRGGWTRDGKHWDAVVLFGLKPGTEYRYVLRIRFRGAGGTVLWRRVLGSFRTARNVKR